MAMYALAVVPLIKRLHMAVPSVQQVWYADDATSNSHVYIYGKECKLIWLATNYFQEKPSIWLF